MKIPALDFDIQGSNIYYLEAKTAAENNRHPEVRQKKRSSV